MHKIKVLGELRHRDEKSLPAYIVVVAPTCCFGLAELKDRTPMLSVMSDQGECIGSVTTSDGNDPRYGVKRLLGHLSDHLGLNKWQQAELFGYDGHSSGLEQHILWLLPRISKLNDFAAQDVRQWLCVYGMR